MTWWKRFRKWWSPPKPDWCEDCGERPPEEKAYGKWLCSECLKEWQQSVSMGG